MMVVMLGFAFLPLRLLLRSRHDRLVDRSLKISEQIDMLGKLLAVNGIDVKVNKYNILTKVSDYIRELQEKTVLAAQSKQSDNNLTVSSSSSSLKGKCV